MKLSTLDAFPDELDGVARACPTASFYQTRAWLSILADVYDRLELRVIVAEDGGRAVGYLPYFLVRKGPLHSAWSLPFGTYGGPVTLDDGAGRELLESYRGLRSRNGVVEVGWVDYHGTAAPQVAAPTALLTWSEARVIDLSGGFDAWWNDQLSAKRRERARRAQRLGVTVRRGERRDLDAFYRIYRTRIAGFEGRNLYPRALFERIFERREQGIQLYMAELGGRVVGGHVKFIYGDTMISWYGMVSEADKHSQANTLLYVESVREACAIGVTRCNLGSSLGKASLAHFKESLGGVTHRYAVCVERTLLGRAAARVRRLTSRR